jgi:hypothetical protein
MLAQPAVGLNYAVALKLQSRPMDAQTVMGNLNPASGALNEYAQKVEKFIKE